MKAIRTLLYLLLNLAACQLYLLFHQTRWDELLDLPALLFVLAGLALSLATHPLSELLRALGQAGGWIQDSATLARSRLVFETMGRYLLLAGLLGTLLGMIQALASFEQARLLGPALATSLNSLVYALMLRFLVLYPLQVGLARQDLALEA